MKTLIFAFLALTTTATHAGIFKCSLKEVSERPPIENTIMAQDVDGSGYYGIVLKGERFSATTAFDAKTKQLDVEIRDSGRVVSQSSTMIQLPLNF